MKKSNHSLSASLSILALVSGLGIGPVVMAEEKDDFSSSSSSEITGTAGVRGGDVMGQKLLKSRPNPGAVSRMEQRKVSEPQLNQFQKQGKLGRFSQ